MTAAICKLVLILLPLFAAFSNVAHAKPASPAPIVEHHASHGQAPAHHEEQAPCCDMQSCVGCAVPAIALALPDRGEALPFADHAVFAEAMLVNYSTVPDPPPPRAQS